MQVVFSTSLGIFVSDGTEDGTSVVAALPDPTGYATTEPFASLGAQALFIYQDGVSPYVPSLWVTDGTAGGTDLIYGFADDSSGDYFPRILDLVSLGDDAVFAYPPLPSSTENLWVTDGTAEGTINLAIPGIENPILEGVMNLRPIRLPA